MVSPCFRGCGSGESGIWKGHQKDGQIWGGSHNFIATPTLNNILYSYISFD